MNILPAKDFKPGIEGIFSDLPSDVYHHAPGISQSTLKAFDEAGSPFHFKMTPRRQATPDMEFGTVMHTAILEPEKLPGSYEIIPEQYPVKEKKKKTPQTAEEHHDPEQAEPVKPLMKPWNKGAKFCEDWHAKREGKICLKKDRHEAVTKIVSNLIQKHSFFCKALNAGRKELSFFKRDEESGLLMKCRTDLIVQDAENNKWIFDLKKVQSGGAKLEEFQQSISDWGYHIQESSYKAITGANYFIFVVYDDDAPFDSCLWELPPEISELGKSEYNRIFRKFADCFKSDNWPGYPEGINKMETAPWMRKRQTELNDMLHNAWFKGISQQRTLT